MRAPAGNVDTLLAELDACRNLAPDDAYRRAHDALMAYIDVPEVTAAFEAVTRHARPTHFATGQGTTHAAD